MPWEQPILQMVGLKPVRRSEELSYIRLAEKKFQPDGIIDVGAYEGEWTKTARRVFPHVPILMVEAQESKQAILENVCANVSATTYSFGLLGATSGENVVFFEMETGSSYYPELSNAPRTAKQLSTNTLDEVANGFSGNNLFLKIDVQGAELEVLAGGCKTLQRCEVVQLEVAMLTYNDGAPTILEVLQYMDARDFVPFDISGESRPQGHLVQIDILFTRRNSTLRPHFINF